MLCLATCSDWPAYAEIETASFNATVTTLAVLRKRVSNGDFSSSSAASCP